MSVVLPIDVDDRYRIITASAGQTVLAISFPWQDNADIELYKADVVGAWMPLVRPTDYSLAGVGTPSGGSATLSLPAVAGDKFLILGSAVLDRVASIVREGRFSSKTIDDDFDRNRIIQQEQRRDIDRSFKVDYGQTPPSIPKPAQNRVLGWNGGALTNIDPAEFINDAGFATSAQGGKADTAVQPRDLVGELDFVAGVTGAEPRDALGRLRETMHIRDLHRAEDGDDYTATIHRWQDFISGSVNSTKLLITDGIYEHDDGGNWAKSNLEIKTDGSARLRNTGTGDNFVLDAGNTDNIWNVLIEGNLLLEGNGLSGHGARIRAIHHSQIGSLNVRGCGAAKAGIYMEFGVCSRLVRPIVSLNEGAWYAGAQPLYGLLLERRTGSADPSPVAFSHVENPVIEHVQFGANLANALGVRISNGTIEGCTAGGLLISTDSNENVIDRVNFEANNGFDIYCEGDYNEFQSVYSLGLLRDGPGANDGLNLNGSARGNKVLGGVFNAIRLGASTFDNLLIGVAYNRYGVVTPLNDLGTRNRMLGLYDMTNTIWHDAPRKRTVLTLTGSPFTYVNTSANPEILIVNGGTVTGIDYINAGVGDATGLTHGTFYLFPGGALQIAYSSAPTVIVQRG